MFFGKESSAIPAVLCSMCNYYFPYFFVCPTCNIIMFAYVEKLVLSKPTPVTHCYGKLNFENKLSALWKIAAIIEACFPSIIFISRII